jgi:hypothetical protein
MSRDPQLQIPVPRLPSPDQCLLPEAKEGLGVQARMEEAYLHRRH